MMQVTKSTSLNLIDIRYKKRKHPLTKLQVILLTHGADKHRIDKALSNTPSADNLKLVDVAGGINNAFQQAEQVRCHERGWVTIILDNDCNKLCDILPSSKHTIGYKKITLDRQQYRFAILEDCNRVFYKFGYDYASYELSLQRGAKSHLVDYVNGINGGNRLLPNWSVGWFWTGTLPFGLNPQMDEHISYKKTLQGYKIVRFVHRVLPNTVRAGIYMKKDCPPLLPNHKYGMGRNHNWTSKLISRDIAAQPFEEYIEEREV